MAFVLKGTKSERNVEFSIGVEDGDLNIYANGRCLGYISHASGKLRLFAQDEEDREAITGAISLSNGYLSVELL